MRSFADFGPGGYRSPTPGGFAPEFGAAVSLPPFDSPPRGALMIDRAYQTAPLGSGVRGKFVAAAGDVIVPQNQQARLSMVGFGSLDPAGLTQATFEILVNDVPQPEYQGIALAVGTLDAPTPIVLHVPGPATITIYATNNFITASTFTYNARLLGWIYMDRAKLAGE